MSTIVPTYDKTFVDRLAGANLLKPKVAIIELIANAWDAGATKVEIFWPTKEQSHFEIRDNGHGMSSAEFSKRYMQIMYNRVAGQGSSVEFESRGKKVMRRTFGKNGLGRMGGFSFADSYRLATTTDGKDIASYLIAKGAVNAQTPFTAEVIPNEKTFKQSGTIIYTPEAKATSIDITELKKEIGLRFLSDPDFSVFVNGEKVELQDIPTTNVTALEAKVDGVTIPILAIDTQTPDGNTYQHGVAWHVQNRLVGDCSWRGPNNEKFIDGRKSVAKRFTFIVNANHLEADVVPDWTGFNAKSHAYQRVFAAVEAVISKFVFSLAKEKNSKVFDDIREANANTVRKLSPIERVNWEDFVLKTQEECDYLREDQLLQISTILANLQLAKSRFALLHKLSGYNPDQLDDLDSLLAEWGIDTAKVVLDEIKTRLKLIAQMETKLHDEAADELHDLQPLFEAGLWILGPKYESILFTSNRGMTAVLNKLGSIKTKGSKLRPDFVVLTDGTVGLYTLPAYDSENAEIGISELVILELKKAGIPIGDEQKSQCWEYVKELRVKGMISETTTVQCYVLGSALKENESGERKEGKNITITPMLYDTVLKRANSRLFGLKKRIESAPFLNEDELKDFSERSEAYDKNQTNIFEEAK